MEGDFAVNKNRGVSEAFNFCFVFGGGGFDLALNSTE